MNYKYNLENLDCANCAKKIEDKLNKDKRFKNVVVNFNLLTLSFKTDIESPFIEVKNIVKSVEPEVIVKEDVIEHKKIMTYQDLL